MALRLYLAHLPSRTIAAQLPRDLLISVGLGQVILPILVVAGFYATWRILRGSTAPPTKLVRQWKERSPRDWSELVAGSALPALVVAGVMARAKHHVRGGWEGLAWLVSVTFLLTMLGLLVGLNLRARLVASYGESASSWSAVRPVVRMTLVVALAFLPICVLFAGVFYTLLNAKVCTTSGSYTKGVLIGETSDRTYIGQKRKAAGPLLVLSIPRSEIRQTFIGEKAGARPCPVEEQRSG